MTNDYPTLCNCLYFTANAVSRAMTKMAEEEFRMTGVSPSHAFLLLLANAKPGITPTELATELHLAPSTVTRFIDKLAHKGLLERQGSGKTVGVYPTEKGRDLQAPIYEAWQNLFKQYCTILGEENAINLTQLLDEASQKLDV